MSSTTKKQFSSSAYVRKAVHEYRDAPAHRNGEAQTLSVFGFVHQNPKNVRKSLHIKDEDYRLSFLFGNYLTLTNVDEAELQRIIDQRLSPLYVSVHATEPELRRTLLGIEEYDGFMGKVERLAKAGIQLHGQVVLGPGLN